MPRWWVFPRRSPIRLFYRQGRDKKAQYVVRVGRGTDPGLDAASWEPLTPERTSWVSISAETPPVPARRWRNLGGEMQELDGTEIRRRYQLLDCPPKTVAVGQNEFGQLVREHDGRRWIQQPANAGTASWLGDEIANPPAAVLRFGTRAAWCRLARWLVGQASRGQLSLDEDELRRLAAVLVDPGRRPSFQPWIDDPGESHRLLLEGMREAVTMKDKDGQTPLDVARAALDANDRLVRLLLEVGAGPGAGVEEPWPGERQ